MKVKLFNVANIILLLVWLQFLKNQTEQKCLPDM